MNTPVTHPLIVIPFPQFYGVHGIARYLQSFLANAPAEPGKLLLLTSAENRHTLDVGRADIEILPMAPGRLGLLRWSLAMRRRIKQLARAHPDLIVNLHIPPLIPGLLLPRGVRCVVTAHTTYLGMSGQFYRPPLFRSQWSAVSVWAKRLMERWIFRRADKLITLTHQGLAELHHYGIDRPVDILPNGVDIARFERASEPGERYDVLFVGRIEKRKGSRPMVDVCKRLVERYPAIRIAIAGFGDDDAYVNTELVPLAANVSLLGKQSFSDVVRAYKQSRLYASTSYYEGLPGTCLEAMAIGLPAVVWDFPFYRDLVQVGATGRLVAVGDIEGFVDAVIELVRDPDAALVMGSAGRALVAAEYDWRRLADRVLSSVTDPHNGQYRSVVTGEPNATDQCR